MIATIPETLRICTACKDELAASGIVCDGCRGKMEAHRAEVLSSLDEIGSLEAKLRTMLRNVERALMLDAPPQPIEPPKLLTTSESDWTFPIALAIALTGCSILGLAVYGVWEICLHWK